MSPEQERALIGMIFQFLKEENYTETLHRLESESACYLNMKHIQELVLDAKWEEVERYLSAFSKVGDNNNSTRMFFEIRKQKYLEALDSRDLRKAVNILTEELKVFAVTWEDEFKELTHLLTEKNFRQHKRFISYTTAKIERMILMTKLISLFEANPRFRDKLSFPSFNDSRLRYLFSQSIDWQQMVCQQNHPCSDMTLLTDHDCRSNLRGNELEGVNTRYEEGSSSVSWRLMEVSQPLQCRSLVLPGSVIIDKISTLVYTNSGILLLAENGLHQFWRWPVTSSNPHGKATTKNAPKVWQPESGGPMVNDLMNVILLERTSCFALSNNASFIVSSSGGAVSLFNIISFEKLTDFMKPPPMATALAFHSRDNTKIAVGMDDSTIQIYDLRLHQVSVKLAGHFARVTGLAFSHTLNLLVSTGADSQIIAWESTLWIKQRSVCMRIRAERTQWVLRNTKVQFHRDEKHFLAYDETQLAIYKATSLTRVNQWVSSAPISLAVFSCDCQRIYACFRDGVIDIFCSARFVTLCRILPSAYIPQSLSLQNVQPTAMAANPEEANQFAIGFSDGRVFILEPHESNERWEVPPPVHASMSRVHASSSSVQPWSVPQ